MIQDQLQRIVTMMVTKEDLGGFATKKDFEGFATKKDLERFPTKEELYEALSSSETRMLAMLEVVRDDMIGTHKDKISQHEDRIVALEVHAGIR